MSLLILNLKAQDFDKLDLLQKVLFMRLEEEATYSGIMVIRHNIEKSEDVPNFSNTLLNLPVENKLTVDEFEIAYTFSYINENPDDCDDHEYSMNILKDLQERILYYSDMGIFDISLEFTKIK